MRIATLKLAAITLLCGSFCLSSSAQLKLTKNQDDLKGPVRTVQTTTANIQRDYTNTKYVETESPRETASYDRQGRKTEQYFGFYKNDSPATGKEGFVYDSQARLQEIIQYDGEGKIDTRFVSSYDQRGRLISLVGSGSIKPSLFSGNGPPLEMRVTFDYSDSGKIVRYTVRDKEENLPLFLDSISTYDRNDNVLDEKLSMFGSLLTHQTYTYDSRGRLIKMRESNLQDHRSAEEFYSSDDRGNPTEITRYSGPKPVLERKTLLSYDYDAAGNWVRKSVSGWSYAGKQYQPGVSKIVPYTVTRRVITYYE